MAMAVVWTLEQNENLLKAFRNFPFACICNQIYDESNEIPSAAFHTKGQLHVHFLGISRRDYHGAVGCAKKKDLFRYSELIKLLSITETLLLLTPAWKMKCSEAFAALETGVPGRGGGEGVQGTHHLPVCTACTLCLGYGHSLSLKYEGYKTLKIWRL